MVKSIHSTFVRSLIVIPLVVAFVGCSEMPGNRQQQGAVIGGAAGAAAGAAIGGSKHRVLGALLGGALGAGGGYVIAAKTDHIKSGDTNAAVKANSFAQSQPATAEQARSATTADLNSDGFVTLDEVVAMKQAGLSDETIVQKLKATDQVFELTTEQERYLQDRGISQTVVQQMEQIRQSGSEGKDVISR
jgi:hypothetical protein